MLDRPKYNKLLPTPRLAYCRSRTLLGLPPFWFLPPPHGAFPSSDRGVTAHGPQRSPFPSFRFQFERLVYLLRSGSSSVIFTPSHLPRQQMADLLTVVPGSRRPIRIDSTGIVVNIAIQRSDHSSFSSKTGTNSSASRRKPQTTYRSPSLQFPSDLRIERSGQCIRHSPSGHGPPLPTSTRSSNANASHGLGGVRAAVPDPNAPTAVKPKYPMRPPLPIYHPLGRLALSLPQLDFSAHPQSPLSQADDATRGTASRTRRPAARLRDAADTDSVDAGTPLAVLADAPAPPDKPSPRKRRSGGQSSSRRRRREADDGDATYPAKRTRASRAPPVPPSDGGSPGNGGADAAEVDGSEEGTKAPERRSTRSRAAAQAKPPPVRRNSSASDRTQTSVSVSIAGSQLKKEDVDVAPPNGTVRSSAATSGQAASEAVSITNATLDETAMQGIQTGVPGRAETQTVSKMDEDEVPHGAEDPGLGTSVVSQKPEEGELNEEGGPRSPSS
ncbi:hypothetical protein BJV74DRAFT_883192 [Russula compacta]|nr:hypothetical protein BJV74DRAFT_883192 [Russula compacta]